MTTKATAATFEEDEDVVATGTTTTAASDVDTSMDVDFGNQNIIKQTGFLEKLMPPEKSAKVVRANLLTDLVKPKAGYTHYIEGKGAFKCMSTRDPETGKVIKEALCCIKTKGNDRQKAGFAVLALVVHYTNASETDGKYAKGAAVEYDIKFVKLSRSGYATLSRMQQEDGEIVDFDFLIANKGGGKGVGFEYSVITPKARARQNPELWEEIVEAVEQYKDGKALISRFGKVLNPKELAAEFAGVAAASAAEATVDDVDDI